MRALYGNRSNLQNPTKSVRSPQMEGVMTRSGTLIPRSPVTRSEKPSVSKSDISSGNKKRQNKSREGTKRSYFKVGDDWEIMLSIKKHSKASMTKIAQKLSIKLGRTASSVRDRIKKYLTKLDKYELKKIKSAAKVIPSILILGKS